MGVLHGSPNGGIYAPGSGRESEKPEHRCGLCFGPYGKSAIRCKNEPKEVGNA